MKKKLLIYADRYIEKIDEKKYLLQEEGIAVYTVHEDDVSEIVAQLGKIENFYFTDKVSIENQNIFSQNYNAQKMG